MTNKLCGGDPRLGGCATAFVWRGGPASRWRPPLVMRGHPAPRWLRHGLRLAGRPRVSVATAVGCAGVTRAPVAAPRPSFGGEAPRLGGYRRWLCGGDPRPGGCATAWALCATPRHGRRPPLARRGSLRQVWRSRRARTGCASAGWHRRRRHFRADRRPR